jgi:hypothetical protein
MSNSNKIVDLVCATKEQRDQFKNLEDYFGTLVPDQLAQEDLESFIEMAMPKDKILMSVFIHRYLSPYLEQSTSYKSDSYRSMSLVDGKLDARGCLTSNALPLRGKLKLSDAPSYLKEKCQSSLQTRCINLIDLSANDLLSGDIRSVKDFVDFLRPYLSDNTVLNLESNRIHGVGAYREVVESILVCLSEYAEIGYIDLRSNPFCSVDRLDFFKNLGFDKKLTKMLIWIEDYNLASNGWIHMVNSEEVAEVVRKAHTEYFKLLRR